VEPYSEASTSDREHWRLAQSELYYQLPQLSHHGNGAALKGQGGAESHVEPPAKPEPTTTTRHGSFWKIGAKITARLTPRGMARPESPGGSTGARWELVPGIAFGGVPVGHLPPPGSWEEKNGAINSSLFPIRH